MKRNALRSSMFAEWVAGALAYGNISQAECSRRLTEQLRRKIDAAAVNKIVKGTRALAADEMMAISAITGYPVPGASAAPAPSGQGVDEPTLLRLMSESFRAFGRSARQSDFLAAAILTIATSPSEIQSLQSDADFSERFRALVDQVRRAAP